MMMTFTRESLLHYIAGINFTFTFMLVTQYAALQFWATPRWLFFTLPSLVLSWFLSLSIVWISSITHVLFIYVHPAALVLHVWNTTLDEEIIPNRHIVEKEFKPKVGNRVSYLTMRQGDIMFLSSVLGHFFTHPLRQVQVRQMAPWSLFCLSETAPNLLSHQHSHQSVTVEFTLLL